MEKLFKIIFVFLSINGVWLIKEVIHAFFLSYRLNQYIKKHNYQKWRELTSIGSAGPGLSNPFKWIPWIFTNENNEDENITRLKDKLRIRHRWIFLIIISIFVTIITTTLIFF